MFRIVRRGLISASVAAALVVAVGVASAATPPKPGQRCPKAGEQARAQGLVCVKRHGKLVWVPYQTLGSSGGNGNAGHSGNGKGGSSGGGNSGGDAQVTAPILAALPVDLSQIAEISKFRSCSGHDFSGYDAQDQPEADRSMKHYFRPIASLIGTTGQIKVYSPINGTIMRTAPEYSGRGTQVWVGTSQIGWNVILFHLDPVGGITTGAAVKAGQLVGYANLENAFDFDIAYQRPEIGKNSWAEDSIFSHMSPTVLAAFAARGITPANIIFSKAERDAAPCTTWNGNPDDYIQLTG